MRWLWRDWFLRICKSLEDAEANPQNVGVLELFGPLKDSFIAAQSFSRLKELAPKLVKLRSFCVASYPWFDLPAELLQLNSLKAVRILNLPLKTFPPFCSANEITSLAIRGTDLEVLPPSIASLRQLRELDVSDNPLRSIDPALGTLPNLQKLCLADNGLTTLPEELSRLTNLRQLILVGRNRFSQSEAKRIRSWFRSNVVSIVGSDESTLR